MTSAGPGAVWFPDLSFTPRLQPGVNAGSEVSNRFNGFPLRSNSMGHPKTVETVPRL